MDKLPCSTSFLMSINFDGLKEVVEFFHKNINNLNERIKDLNLKFKGYEDMQSQLKENNIKIESSLRLLHELEERLDHSRYLFGDKITEADVRLYVTLARFDIAYYNAFKVNLKTLKEYKNLWAYARDLYQTKGFGDTTNFGAIKKHYHLIYVSKKMCNYHLYQRTLKSIINYLLLYLNNLITRKTIF